MLFVTFFVFLVTFSVMFFLVLAMAVTMSVAVAFMMDLAVARRVHVVIPVVVDKVDWLAAGSVLAAVFVPVLRVAGRNVKIDRLPLDAHRDLVNNDRLTVDNLRLGKIADIDATIETGLADAYRHGGDCRGSRGC